MSIGTGDRNTKLNKTFFCFKGDCTSQQLKCSIRKCFPRGTDVILRAPGGHQNQRERGWPGNACRERDFGLNISGEICVN